MRKKFFLAASLLCFVTSVYAQTDPVEYLNIIGEQFNSISHEMMSYTSAVNHGKSARKIEKRRVDFMAQIKESEKTVRRLKPFNGKTTLRDSIAAYFKLTQIILNQDYGKILDLEDIAEQSYDAMEAYLLAKEKASDKGDAAFEAAMTQYDAFAAENNIKLRESESELTKKLEKTSLVVTYTNKVYLLFFKSYKNEAYLLDAMSRDDMSAVEQVRNALSSSATEDLVKLRTLQAFQGDATLRNALQQALNFYKTEADTRIKTFTDFLLAKDNMEKIKKTYDATASSNRTQQQVDAYNKSVNEFNQKVNAANAMNNDLNKKRSAMLKNWNDSYEDFLDKHTPKYK